MDDTAGDSLRELIDREADGPVLSVFCRTDPRDPANTSETPGWLIALRNGLRELDAEPELAASAERRLSSLPAAERGRSVALFLNAGGEVDFLKTFQIPVREDFAALDSGPVVWPMVDVIDRGQRTGLVLLSSGRVRLLDWSDGRAEDVEGGSWDLELGDWREYRGAARANPARGQQSVVNTEAYRDRVKDWQARFVRDSAAKIADAAARLDLPRLVVAADGDLGSQFQAALPDTVAEKVAAVAALNLIDLTAAEVADHLDQHLRDAWRTALSQRADEALARVKSGGAAASGPEEVLLALTEGRVEHLIFDPYLKADASTLPKGARQAIEDAGESTLQEALVEVAIRTGARASSVSVDEVPALAEADGALALLRY